MGLLVQAPAKQVGRERGETLLRDWIGEVVKTRVAKGNFCLEGGKSSDISIFRILLVFGLRCYFSYSRKLLTTVVVLNKRAKPIILC